MEIQLSAKSDLTGGLIDVGVLVGPNDKLGLFLIDRGPRIADARRHLNASSAENLPLVLMGIEHDSLGQALAK